MGSSRKPVGFNIRQERFHSALFPNTACRSFASLRMTWFFFVVILSAAKDLYISHSDCALVILQPSVKSPEKALPFRGGCPRRGRERSSPTILRPFTETCGIQHPTRALPFGAVPKHSMQILRSAQDDMAFLRRHPEHSEGSVHCAFRLRIGNPSTLRQEP